MVQPQDYRITAILLGKLDRFFERKKNEEQAALFRSDELMFDTEDERRAQYAATWVLMALTRAMDTVYIQINDPSSEFGQVIMDYYNGTKLNSEKNDSFVDVDEIPF